MPCGAVPCLASYATIVTIILVIISVLYSKTGNYPVTRPCIDGEELQESETHVDFLNIDVSSNEQTGQIGENGEWIIYSGFKMSTEGKTWFKKWKEARKTKEEQKFEKMRARYEASTSRGRTTIKLEPRETNRGSRV